MIKNIIFILSTVILLVSCDQEILLDNPTSEDVKVVVQGKNILVKANSLQKMKVSEGMNEVLSISSLGDTLLNESVDIVGEGVLNITKAEYAIWRDVFCEEVDYETYKLKLNLKDTVVIDGLEFVDLDLELINATFISKTWDYGLDKEMPETIEIKEEEKFKIVTKIYHALELKEVFNYYGDYDFKDLTEKEINKILNSNENN